MASRIAQRTTTNVIAFDAKRGSTLATIRIASMRPGCAIGPTTAATDPMREIATGVIRGGSASAAFPCAKNSNVLMESAFPLRKYATECRIVWTEATNLENAVRTATL